MSVRRSLHGRAGAAQGALPATETPGGITNRLLMTRLVCLLGSTAVLGTALGAHARPLHAAKIVSLPDGLRYVDLIAAKVRSRKPVRR